MPRLAEAVLDLPVLLVAVALSTATGLLFGLMPALRLTHSADRRGGTADPRGVRIRQMLIAGVTGFGSFAIYEGLIRPFPLFRFLFGLKLKTKEGAAIERGATAH